MPSKPSAAVVLLAFTYLTCMAELRAWPAPEVGSATRPGRQDPTSLGRISYSTFTDQEGLPQNSIQCIATDSRKYLWVGTQDGAAYYNGHSWTVVDMPSRSTSNWVYSICVMDDGAMWFGTFGGGLHRLQDGNWTSYDTSNGLPSNRVWCVERDVDEAGAPFVWAGTESGLAAVRDGVLRVYTVADGLPCDRVRDVLPSRAADGSCELLVATFGGGVVKLAGGLWTRLLDTSTGMKSDLALRLLETRTPSGERVLWTCTRGGGLARLHYKSLTIYDEFNGLRSSSVWEVVEQVNNDGTATLWAGTDGGGLARFQNGEWTNYDTRSGLLNNVVFSLLLMRSATGTYTLWVGTFSGLLRMETGKWITIDQNVGLPSDVVFSMLESVDADGTQSMWFGTYGSGLARLRNGKWTFYDIDDERSDDLVMALHEAHHRDGTSTLWAGTRLGLSRFDGSRWRPFPLPKGLLTSHTNAVLEVEDADGRRELWVGTYGSGVLRLAGGTWTVFDTSNGIPDNLVTCLAQTVAPDGRRTIWAGTRGGGLARFDNGAWTVIDSRNGLRSDLVTSLQLVTDAAGRKVLWVGTFGGLSRLALYDEAAHWETLYDGSDPPLPNNVIYQIRADHQGRIYVFTNRGVSRLTPRAPTPDDPSPFVIYTFTTGDGLPSNGCVQGSSLVDRKGRIWAGTVAGVAVFDPSTEIADYTRKPLYIEHTWVGGVERTLENDATLAYYEPNITFEYALLSYFREGDTRYRSQLVGFEAVPTQWSRDYKREFSNLEPGSYQFLVWGRDYAGNVTGPAQFSFKVAPAPWRTWYAYLVFVLLFFLLAWALVLWRSAALRDQNKLLEEKVLLRTAQLAEKIDELEASERRARDANRAKSSFLATMSHELRTPLNAILGFVQLLGRGNNLDAEQREQLAIISRCGEHLLQLINNVLSVSKIEAGQVTLHDHSFDLHGMLAGVEDMFRLRAASRNLTFTVIISEAVPRFVGGDEGKLRQVLINLLGNAFKFTRQGGVTLRVDWLRDEATFEVEDTGPGIAAEELDRLFRAFTQAEAGRVEAEGTGLGLAISRSFVRLMGGDIDVRSEVGTGSRFSFTIRLRASEPVHHVAEKRRVAGLVGEERPVVLVADHQWENRSLLAQLLEGVGFRVVEAQNGDEAIRQWRNHCPALLWMDLEMPGGGGLEAVREIRRLESDLGVAGDRRVRIVGLTANALDQDRQAVLAAGCDDLVTKPYREAEILETMAMQLDLRYQYEEQLPKAARANADQPAFVDAAELARLPLDLCSELHQAATIGDVEACNGLLDRITDHDETLATRLREAIRKYRFDDVIDVLERAMGLLSDADRG
jgi:signal transduction histidine kinase/CheY-like chemotaxis protein